jgi:hypothetical protein
VTWPRVFAALRAPRVTVVATALWAVCALLSEARAADHLAEEFTITPEKIEAAPDYLTQVIVPDASCAAVNDAQALLVVGSKAVGEKQLAVFKLDTAGQPAAEPVWLKLPKPDALAAKPNYPLGLLWHPRLPILYVWQDVDAPAATGAKKALPNEYAEFDHLLVYGIKDGALELLQTTASGEGFKCGLKAGTVGLDHGAKNLFVPNATGETADEAGIAFFALDDEGLPGETAEEAADQKGKRVKNLTLAKNGKTMKPVLLPKQLRTGHYYPSGTGWYAGSEALIMGGYSGCMMADFHNGGLRQTWFSIPILAGSCFLTGHPTLPALYMCLNDHNHLYAVAQVNGYVTLLPQIALVTGTHLSGLPVVLTKQSRLAVTEARSLHLLGLKADGKFDGQDQMLALAGGVGKGLAYSEKLGRLFVAVDKAN